MAKVSNCYKQRFSSKARKLNKPRPLVDYLRPFVNGGTIILDVGSGPFPTIGTIENGVMIRACDIAADGYYELMFKHGIEPLIPVEHQNMEAMTYSSNSFDIVHCRNALDHTRNPRGALMEMARVCKPFIDSSRCGRVYLCHYPNVGHHNKYAGQHEWNLKLHEGDCMVWNREDAFLMSEFLPDVAVYMDKGMVVCHWVK